MRSRRGRFPIRSSEFRLNYLAGLQSHELPMREVYRKFQAELNAQYKNVKRFPICPGSQKGFYVPVK